MKKNLYYRKIEKGQEKVSRLKSPFGVIKFDKSEWKLSGNWGFPKHSKTQTVGNAGGGGF